MTALKFVSGLVASACVAWVIPGWAAAQSTSSPTDSLLLAQSETPDVLMELETQPEGPDDLGVLSLTDEQAAEIVAIFETYQPQIEAARVDYLEALGVLNDLLAPQTANLALNDARNNVITAERQIEDLIFQQNMEIRSVLDPEQRQVINDFIRAWLDIGPADPVAVFPMNLIGQDISTTLPELEADGWVEVVRTPSLVELDRGSEQLDLDLQRGEIVDASYSN